MNGARYDADEVRASLAVDRVLGSLGLTVRGQGRELRGRSCPQRPDHTRADSFSINRETGLWHCHACGIGGDLLDLIALAHHLDARRDFGAVLELGAAIGDVQPASGDAAEMEDRRRRLEARRREADTRAAARYAKTKDRRDRAMAEAAEVWSTLPTRGGESYVRERGIERVLDVAPGAVRFTADGIAVALHDRNGGVRNIVTRRYPDLGEPKVVGRRDCPTAGTLVGHLGQLGNSPGSIVLAEGVVDSLTAVLAFPGCIVLGAHGASNIPAIARAVAPRIRGTGRRLLFPVHDDAAGHRAATEAIDFALAAGLTWRRDVEVLNLRGHADLNDAWRAGVRFQ